MGEITKFEGKMFDAQLFATFTVKHKPPIVSFYCIYKSLQPLMALSSFRCWCKMPQMTVTFQVISIMSTAF